MYVLCMRMHMSHALVHAHAHAAHVAHAHARLACLHVRVMCMHVAHMHMHMAHGAQGQHVAYACTYTMCIGMCPSPSPNPYQAPPTAALTLRSTCYRARWPPLAPRASCPPTCAPSAPTYSNPTPTLPLPLPLLPLPLPLAPTRRASYYSSATASQPRGYSTLRAAASQQASTHRPPMSTYPIPNPGPNPNPNQASTHRPPMSRAR